jgi:YHS domain-containing protein
MKETEMAERRPIAPNEDPVCGLTVEPAEARGKGLATTYEDREFVFCGKGCFLEFRDDPETFLDPAYSATM